RSSVAVLAGALPVLAFPAPSLWWFAYVALVPWILLARAAPTGRRGASGGWGGGLRGLGGGDPRVVAGPRGWLLLATGRARGARGWLTRRLLGGVPSAARGAAALLVLPSAWLMVELVRSWQGLGGPWGMLGASQWQVPPALRLASVGGVWLLSFLVVAVNVAAA